MSHYGADNGSDNSLLLLLSIMRPMCQSTTCVCELQRVNGYNGESYVLSLSGARVNTLWTRPVRLAICFSIASIRSKRWSLQRKIPQTDHQMLSLLIRCKF